MTEPNTAIITYPAKGRGAWSSIGGTLNAKGTEAGIFLRLPATGSGLLPPGTAGFRAQRDGLPVPIDHYAVYRAVMAVQTNLRLLGDLKAADNGLWSSATDTALRVFQAREKLTVDGVFGRQSAKTMLRPLVQKYAVEQDQNTAADLAAVMRGLLSTESEWSPMAVGGADPHDLGPCQLHQTDSATLTVNDCFSWATAIPRMADKVDAGIREFGNQRDAIASYNLGIGGARRWISQGRPQWYTPAGSVSARDVWKYIDKVQANSA